MRPVNLIPGEQRRRRSSGIGAANRRGVAVYVLLGALGAAVLAVAALVLTSNQVSQRQDDLAALARQESVARQAADALRPYGDFAQLAQDRIETVRSLAGSRFDWEKVIRELSRTIPSNVWLVQFQGTVSPEVDLSAGGSSGGGGASELRGGVNVPALALTGCAFTQRSVARMMVRMRNIDGVTQVSLAKSERPDNKQQESQSGSGGGDDDCRTTDRITKFDILVVFGAAKLPTLGGGSGSAGGLAQAAATATPQAAQGAEAASQASTTTAGAGR